MDTDLHEWVEPTLASSFVSICVHLWSKKMPMTFPIIPIRLSNFRLIDCIFPDFASDRNVCRSFMLWCKNMLTCTDLRRSGDRLAVHFRAVAQTGNCVWQVFDSGAAQLFHYLL